MLRSRKPSTAELRRDQQREARNGAPTLRVLLPDASHVCVQLTYVGGRHLTDSPRTYTVFPPAQAHFVYDCPFGDCDGTCDLDEEVFSLLHAGADQASGTRYCTGHRASCSGTGLHCGLQVQYKVMACYRPERPAAGSRLARV